MKVTYLQNYPQDTAFLRAGQTIELWQAEDGEYFRFDGEDTMENFTILHRSGIALVHYYFHSQQWIIEELDYDWWGKDTYWEDPSEIMILDEEYLDRRNVPRYPPGDRQ